MGHIRLMKRSEVFSPTKLICNSVNVCNLCKNCSSILLKAPRKGERKLTSFFVFQWYPVLALCIWSFCFSICSVECVPQLNLHYASLHSVCRIFGQGNEDSCQGPKHSTSDGARIESINPRPTVLHRSWCWKNTGMLGVLSSNSFRVLVSWLWLHSSRLFSAVLKIVLYVSMHCWSI